MASSQNTDSVERPPQRPVMAAVWMLGALVSFSMMAIAARELSSLLHVFQIATFRSIFSVAILLPFVFAGGFATIITTKFRVHLLRNSLHFFAQYGWIYGVGVLPLAMVFSIEFTVPIWTAIFAAFFLSERMTGWRIAAIGLGFAGILLIVQPGSGALNLGVLAVLGAAVGFGATFVFTRYLSAFDKPMAILFWMNLIQLPIGLIPAVTVWVWPPMELVPWVVVMGVGGLTAHWSVANAMRLADATLVAPMDFIRLPVITVVGVMFYAEPWNPFVLFGGALIFFGNMLNLFGERKRG